MDEERLCSGRCRILAFYLLSPASTGSQYLGNKRELCTETKHHLQIPKLHSNCYTSSHTTFHSILSLIPRPSNAPGFKVNFDTIYVCLPPSKMHWGSKGNSICPSYQMSQLGKVSTDAVKHVPNVLCEGLIEGKGVRRGTVPRHDGQGLRWRRDRIHTKREKIFNYSAAHLREGQVMDQDKTNQRYLGSLSHTLRPKTNPSVDRFQYHMLYWKQYTHRMRCRDKTTSY